MFSLRVSIAKRLGLYLKSIRERYRLSSQHCGLDALMLLQLGVPSPNRFCLSIHPVLFSFSSTSSANPLGLYEFFECVRKMLCSTQHACVIFVALLSCKYMREDNSFGIHLCSLLTDHCFWFYWNCLILCLIFITGMYKVDWCWLTVLYIG